VVSNFLQNFENIQKLLQMLRKFEEDVAQFLATISS